MCKGTKFKCPIWVAISLFDRKLINLTIPKWYEEDFLNVALAGPTITNLKDKN